MASERAVAINTVQGIGDLFWSYQKLAPHFDRINLHILCRSFSPIQQRAAAFCRMLPKVGAIAYVRVTAAHYQRVARSRYALAAIRRAARARPAVDYAVNAPLEQGIPLADIDPGEPVERFVDLGQPRAVEPGDYLCAFVAGAKRDDIWSAPQWADIIARLAERFEVRLIRLIGAEWDREVQASVEQALRGRYAVANHVGAALPESLDIIRRARYFVGYQSGLNVLAENYDVRQLMIYFDHLRPMLYTWCKPESVRTRFHAATFGDDVAAMIGALER
jgi:hypothetical protein